MKDGVRKLLYISLTCLLENILIELIYDIIYFLIFGDGMNSPIIEEIEEKYIVLSCWLSSIDN